MKLMILNNYLDLELWGLCMSIHKNIFLIFSL